MKPKHVTLVRDGRDYRVTRTVNTLAPEVGSILPPSRVDWLIVQEGYEVVVEEAPRLPAGRKAKGT